MRFGIHQTKKEFENENVKLLQSKPTCVSPLFLNLYRVDHIPRTHRLNPIPRNINYYQAITKAKSATKVIAPRR